MGKLFVAIRGGIAYGKLHYKDNIVFGPALVDAYEISEGEHKSDFLREMAHRFGVDDKYTEGKTYRDWIIEAYEATRKKAPELPPLKNSGSAASCAIRFPPIPGSRWRASGAIRRSLFSRRLRARLKSIRNASPNEPRRNRSPKASDRKSRTPYYVVSREMLGKGDPLEAKYPLEAYGYHGKGHTHSSYANLLWLKEIAPDELMINPIDAEPRGIKTGDDVIVKSDRGAIRLPAKR